MGNNQKVNLPSLRSDRAIVGALVVAAYLAGAGALAVLELTGSSTPWWPAAGLGVVAVLLTPRRHWPMMLGLLFLAFTLANVTAGRPVLIASLLGLADVAETLVVVTLLRRYVGRRMDDVADVWRLFAIATVGALVAATGISLVYDRFLGGAFWPFLGVTMSAHASSVLLLAPVALLSTRRKQGDTPPRSRELASQVCLLIVITILTFGAAHPTLGFAPLPLMVWAAVRFRAWVVVIEQIFYAVAVTVLTLLGWGHYSPLAQSDPGHQTEHGQLYLLSLVLICLPLVMAMAQRDEALARLSDSERVFRRTFTQSRVPVALVMLEGGRVTFSECNDATAGVLRRAPADLVGQPLDDFLDAPDMTAACRDIAAHTGVTAWSGEVRVHGEGRVRLDGVLSLLEQGEERTFFSLFMVDVTAPVELQERLQAERDYTRAVIDTASSMIVLTRLDGTVIAANPATTVLTGFTEEDLVGRPMWELLMSGGQRELAAAAFADPSQRPDSGEAQLQTKDGDQRAVIFSSTTHRVSEDAPVTVVISATDVTAARHNAGMVEHLLRSTQTIAFIGTDLAGRITLFNTGAEEMLGVSAEAATGRKFVELIAADDLARYSAVDHPDQTTFEAIVDQVAEDRSPETRDWTLLPTGRAPVHVSMTTNPVIDTFGDLFGYLFVASDVTDTRRSQEILVKALRNEREAVARLKHLDRVKDDFVTTVSHELRTPMSSIIGCAEMLSDGMLGELEPEQETMIDVISRNGDRLLALADDLLLLAKFDQSALPEQMTDVDLRTVVEESAAGVAPLLRDRGLAVGYDLPAQPVLVHGDAVHLERAVTNLLTNAVKFNEDGGHVQVAVVANPANDTVHLSVNDTGIGIDPADLDQVFGRFFRSEKVQERAIQGTGLGLAIVKTIVELHRGHVEVHSDQRTGTTFTMTFPLVRAPAGRRPSAVA